MPVLLYAIFWDTSDENNRFARLTQVEAYAQIVFPGLEAAMTSMIRSLMTIELPRHQSMH